MSENEKRRTEGGAQPLDINEDQVLILTPGEVDGQRGMFATVASVVKYEFMPGLTLRGACRALVPHYLPRYTFNGGVVIDRSGVEPFASQGITGSGAKPVAHE